MRESSWRILPPGLEDRDAGREPIYVVLFFTGQQQQRASFLRLTARSSEALERRCIVTRAGRRERD